MSQIFSYLVMFLFYCFIVYLKASLTAELERNQISSIHTQLTTGDEESAQDTDRTDDCVRILQNPMTYKKIAKLVNTLLNKEKMTLTFFIFAFQRLPTQHNAACCV